LKCTDQNRGFKGAYILSLFNKAITKIMSIYVSATPIKHLDGASKKDYKGNRFPFVMCFAYLDMRNSPGLWYAASRGQILWRTPRTGIVLPRFAGNCGSEKVSSLLPPGRCRALFHFRRLCNFHTSPAPMVRRRVFLLSLSLRNSATWSKVAR